MLSARLLVFAGLAMVASPAVSQDRNLHTDSIGSDVSETTHIFHCDDNLIAISFTERFHRDDSRALVDRWRISLTGLSVSGRQIQPAGMRLLESRFHEYAWIERVTARCTRFNREVSVTAVGMRAEAWAAVGEGATERPRPTSLSFTINENGAVRLN